MGHSPGRGGGRGANPSATAAAGAAAQSQSQSQQHLAAVREQWEAVQAMVAESERTAALLRCVLSVSRIVDRNSTHY